jgi:hypothetical protein
MVFNCKFFTFLSNKTKAFIRIQIRIQNEAWIQTPDSSKSLDPNSLIWIQNTDLDSAGNRVADPDPNCIRIHLSLDPYSGSGSGSRRAKMTHKIEKKLRNFMF